MDIKSFYEAVNGNYDEVMSRLMKEDRVRKYVLRFPASCDLAGLKAAIDAGDHRAVFEISHTMKGMALNLALTEIAESSAELCDSVRQGPPSVDILPLYEKVVSDWQKVSDAVGQLSD